MRICGVRFAKAKYPLDRHPRLRGDDEVLGDTSMWIKSCASLGSTCDLIKPNPPTSSCKLALFERMSLFPKPVATFGRQACMKHGAHGLHLWCLFLVTQIMRHVGGFRWFPRLVFLDTN